MMFIQPGLCTLLLLAGCGWAAWLAAGYRPDGIAAAGLGLSVAASFAAYMATDRKDEALWLRFGLPEPVRIGMRAVRWRVSDLDIWAAERPVAGGEVGRRRTGRRRRDAETDVPGSGESGGVR